MANAIHFSIENDSEGRFSVFVEPESVVVELAQGEKVVVYDEYVNAPVTLRIGNDPTGATVLSVWPGDGNTRVEKNGVDVLDG